MRSLERLEQQKRLERQKRNIPPADEEMEAELEHPRFVPLNQRKNVFDDSAGKMFGGINTAPSVFERQAAIHTEK